MSNIIDSIQLSGVTYTLSAETSGGGITSGEVQTMIDTSISGKVNVSDNQVPAYYKHYEGYYPAQNTYYDYGQGADTVECQTNVFGSSNYGQKITIQVKDSSGNAYSGTSQVMSNKNHKTDPSYFLPSGMGDYLDVTFDIPETEWNSPNARYIVYTAKSGYRITYAEDFIGYDGNYNTAAYIVIHKYSELLFVGGQSANVIKNSIEPALQKLGESKQDTLSAGTGISISGNVISATGGGNPTVELTQAEYDALVSAGTVSADTYYIITDAAGGDLSNYWTSAETQSAITQATSGKVDASSVVSSVTSASTDSEIPTAKAVYDAIPIVTNTITSGSTDAISSGAVYDALGDVETLLSQI